jgi:hypothetical protein
MPVATNSQPRGRHPLRFVALPVRIAFNTLIDCILENHLRRANVNGHHVVVSHQAEAIIGFQVLDEELDRLVDVSQFLARHRTTAIQDSAHVKRLPP